MSARTPVAPEYVKALESVARAAKAWRLRSRPVYMDPREFLIRHPDLNSSPAESRCARALARLDRVSGVSRDPSTVKGPDNLGRNSARRGRGKAKP